MIAADITAPYSAVEAWAYDSVAAPAVVAWLPELADGRLDAVPRGARLLDVGCGGGQNLLAIAERRPDLKITGLDLSERQVARATRRASKAGAAMRFVEGSALDLPFADGEFDAVMSVASIKHWPDQLRGLRECARVLKSGGTMWVVEADRGCHLEDARRFVARFRIPRALLPIALAGFRTWVAGQGIDLDEARRFLEELPLTDAHAQQVPGVPAVLFEGTKL